MPRTEEIVRYLTTIAEAPELDSPEYAQWIEAQDALGFIHRSIVDDVPVYIYQPHFYVYAVLVPLDRLVDEYRTDLLRWNFSASQGWEIGAGRDSATGEPWGVVHEPVTFTESSVLDGAEPVVFVRRFAGHVPDPEYIELNQRIAHVTEVHWVGERNAWSQIDENGDFADLVRFHRFPDGDLCTVNATALDRYLFASNQALVRLFDIGRCADWQQWRTFQGDEKEDQRVLTESDLIAEQVLLRGPERVNGSTLRGAQVLVSIGNREAHVRALLGEDPERNRRASFLIDDWKHGRVREWPPVAGTGGDSAKDDWPELISPAFFRAEVLSRFKRHPEKYTLRQTSIDCRGPWSLRSYDINEAGQVYAYLKDLWGLPYREQLYWRAFNEAPKASISERSIVQDFEARYWTEPDPLSELMSKLSDFPMATHDGQAVAIWSLGSDDPRQALAGLHYVVTDSPKDWGDHVLELVKVVVEGLEKRPLKRIARALGCPEAERSDARSIKLLHVILLAKRIDEDVIEAIHGPLFELNRLRSQAGVAHRGHDRPTGDFRINYRHLLAGVAGAMQRLADQISLNTFDLPPVA